MFICSSILCENCLDVEEDDDVDDEEEEEEEDDDETGKSTIPSPTDNDTGDRLTFDSDELQKLGSHLIVKSVKR